jgi:hypothetical protein
MNTNVRNQDTLRTGCALAHKALEGISCHGENMRVLEAVRVLYNIFGSKSAWIIHARKREDEAPAARAGV